GREPESVSEGLVIAWSVHVHEASFVGYREVHYLIRMGANDPFRTRFKGGPAQLAKDAPIEHHRVAMSVANRRPNDRSAGSPPFSNHELDGLCSKQRDVDKGDDYGFRIRRDDGVHPCQER